MGDGYGSVAALAFLAVPSSPPPPRFSTSLSAPSVGSENVNVALLLHHGSSSSSSLLFVSRRCYSRREACATAGCRAFLVDAHTFTCSFFNEIMIYSCKKYLVFC